jgi:hypothetical protein
MILTYFLTGLVAVLAFYAVKRHDRRVLHDELKRRRSLVRCWRGEARGNVGWRR